MTNKEIKQVSKKFVRNRRGKSMLIVIFTLISLAFFGALPFCLKMVIAFTGLEGIADAYSPYIFPSCVAVAMILLTIWAVCVYSSVSLGEKAWYSGKANMRKNSDKRLFFWFKPSSSFKALKFYIALFGVKLLWSIITLAPAILVLASIVFLAYSGGIEFTLFISLAIGGGLLLIAGLTFRFVIIQRYFLAPYLIASNPKLGAIQAIKQSKNILDGHIFRLVKFKLSFLPRLLSSIFIIPIYFTYPYYKQSCSVIAKDICL